MALLLEVMLGLALVAVVILFVFRLLPAADASVGQADRMSQASQLARRVLEGELARDYDDIVDYTGQAQIQHATRRGSDLTMNYLYSVDVEETAAPKRLKTIVVTVNWSIGSGSSAVNRSVRLETQKGTFW